MKNAKTTARERLAGKPLIGFETKTGAVRMPSAKVGNEAKRSD